GFFEDFRAEGNEKAILKLAIQSDGTNGQASVPDVAARTNTTTIVDDDTATERRFDLPAAGTFTLKQSGGGIHPFPGATLIASEPTGAFHILINGTTGADTLIVDSSGGFPVPSLGLDFEGGDGDDVLMLVNGTFSNEVSTPTGDDEGRILFDSNAPID